MFFKNLIEATIDTFLADVTSGSSVARALIYGGGKKRKNSDSNKKKYGHNNHIARAHLTNASQRTYSAVCDVPAINSVATHHRMTDN